MRRHSPLQQLKEAKQIAIDHGMFVVERKEGNETRYLLYRQQCPRNAYLGKRSTPSGIRSLAASCAKLN